MGRVSLLSPSLYESSLLCPDIWEYAWDSLLFGTPCMIRPHTISSRPLICHDQASTTTVPSFSSGGWRVRCSCLTRRRLTTCLHNSGGLFGRIGARIVNLQERKCPTVLLDFTPCTVFTVAQLHGALSCTVFRTALSSCDTVADPSCRAVCIITVNPVLVSVVSRCIIGLMRRSVSDSTR